MPTPAFTKRTTPELRTPAPWTFEAQGDACCYAITSPNGRWLATIRFNGEHTEEQDLANLALFDVASRTHERTVTTLEESTRMLDMCRELLSDTKHVAKAEFIEQQLVLNRGLLEEIKAGSISRPALRTLPSPTAQKPELMR